MNKFTQKFSEKESEEQYQRYQNTHWLTPLLLLSNLLILLITISSSIKSLIEEQYWQLIPKVILFIFIIGWLFIRKHINHQNNWIIFFLNIMSTVLEFKFDSSNCANAYLIGANTMIIHSFLAGSNGFLLGLSGTVALTIFRIIYTSFMFTTDDITIYNYVDSIILMIGVSIILYYFESFCRLSYLAQAKEIKWERILPHVICKPFLIFLFDNESFQFKQLAINRQLTESQEMQFESVNEFLQQCKFKGKNLQHHLYQKYKNFSLFNQEIICERIEINYKKSKIRIKLITYYVETIRFMIIIENLDQTYIDLKQKFRLSINKMQKEFNKQLKSIFKIIAYNSKKQQNYTKLLMELRISVLEYNLIRSRNKNKASIVNLEKLKKAINKIFSQSQKQRIQLKLNLKNKLLTYKIELYLFILQILKFNNESNFLIEQLKDSQLFQFVTFQTSVIPQSNEFLLYEKILFKSRVSVLNSHYWIFNEVMQSFNPSFTFEEKSMVQSQYILSK